MKTRTQLILFFCFLLLSLLISLWLGDLAFKVITIVGLITGLYLTYREISLYVKFTRANFHKDIVLKFYENKEIRDIFYMIDYNEFKYNEDFHGSENERKLDLLLAFLDVLGELVYKGTLTINDVTPLEYEITRTYTNFNVKMYLNFLRSWFKNNNIDRQPFKGFVYLGEKLSKGMSNKSSVRL